MGQSVFLRAKIYSALYLTYFMYSRNKGRDETLHDTIAHTGCVIVKLCVKPESLLKL